MKLSVACNFDPALVLGLKPYPVYEVFGKITEDTFGGGRPSFYLPEVGRREVEDYVKLCHGAGIEFNYLLNASCMGNMEFTKKGQEKLDETLQWCSDIDVDSITVATLHFLRFIKKRYPKFKVRVSSHRYTDNPRKVRFWQDNGADCIVVSEVNIYREFRILETMRRAATTSELQLIVNNSCRQDCAIAGTHGVSLNHASQKSSGGFPLDYCSVYCMHFRLREPVNYLRANWIRPEDLKLYMDMGYTNFKIVERNCPTQVLLDRTRAYYEQTYDGNLLDLVQNHAYPYEKFSQREHDAYSLRRMSKYFIRPRSINMLKFIKVMELGKRASLLYPRQGENEVFIDNRSLDGFIERFRKVSCQDLDCEECRYCHAWADRTVRISPEFKRDMTRIYDELLDDIHSGGFWEDYGKTIGSALKRSLAYLPIEGLTGTLLRSPVRNIRHFISLLPSIPMIDKFKGAGGKGNGGNGKAKEPRAGGTTVQLQPPEPEEKPAGAQQPFLN
ncbi:MAG: U32 family peptidase [Pseudomonadota bacterium]